jgi:DnaK suppressor protein
LAPALSPRTAPAPRPAPVASAKDVAAATEYLLSRSAHRSEEPTVVNGRQLPTEEQLLKMPESAYMNDDQLAFFKYRLQRMEQELVANAGETTEHLRETVIVPDPADRATIEEEHALELRTRDRERKLLKKVQAALQRIDAGEYGYCEETGDPIGIPRLIARPTATLSLEAQQRRELKQKLFGD